MIRISLRWWDDVEFKFLRAVVLSEPELVVLRVELDVNDIVYRELEGLECGVEFFDGVGPCVAVCGDEVAAMADVGVVEVVVGCFYAVF